jgi:4-phospho-D-threonate 3-dehydrogenase / 4-phospho-D-erythronate 3-dehydrogenase
MSQPIIAITMGDAAGVGPEIIIKALAHREVYERCKPLIIGDVSRLRQAGEIVGSSLIVRPAAGPKETAFEYGSIDCVDLGLIPDNLPWGKLSPLAGDAAFRYIERAVALASANEVDAICTAPLNKEALHAGGHPFPGHTEILAALTHTPEVSMMLMTPKLRVIHVTTHIGLIDAIARIEPGLVERTILRGHEALVRSGIASPASGCAESILMPAKTVCLAMAKRSRRSNQPCRRFRRAASMSKALFRLTPCSSAPSAATLILWSPCTMTRAMVRSRFLGLRKASMSPWASP